MMQFYGGARIIHKRTILINMDKSMSEMTGNHPNCDRIAKMESPDNAMEIRLDIYASGGLK